MLRANNRISEKGQTIILVVISVMIMVVMAALVVDGGNLYLNRRQAQTAADAAALAAAYEYCINNGSLSDANTAAVEYAIVQNDGTALVDLDDDPGNNIEIIYSGGEISVAVEIEKDTFFAKILGRPTGRVEAKASANCFSPAVAENLLPIAWSCRPPIPGEELLGGDGEDTCAIKGIPYNVFEDIKASGFNFQTQILDEGDGVHASTYFDDGTGTMGDPRMIYLIADSLKVGGMLEDVCMELNPLGTVDCDFDPEDGIMDVEGGAERGWLLMDGESNPGANTLKKIVKGEINIATNTPTWFAGLKGEKRSVFGYIQDERVYDYVLIPIFDAVCETSDPVNDNADCPEYYASGEDVIYANGNGDKIYFRVNGFALFFISCVSKNNESCPAKDRAIDNDVIRHNTATVEGYFIEGFVTNGVPGGNHDLGVYILSLTE